MINLIIADDHPIFIDGLKTVLADVPDIAITGEAQNGKQVIELLEYKQADVVLLDIRMPEMNGIETAQIIKKRYNKVKIIMLTQFGDRDFLKKCMELGVDGYLLKDCSQQDLINAIKTVNNGGTWFEIHNKINVTTLEKPKLSKREKEVLKLIYMEFNNEKIAEKLNITKSTVNTYRARLMQKAGVENDIGLFKWALENKMINL